VESLKSRFTAILDKHGLEYDLDWENSSGKPYLTPRGDLVDAVAVAIKQVTGLDTELSTSGGTSDGRFIADICDQIIELGPLNATIHKVNECVAVADLDALSDIYRLTLEALLVNKK
jgi:succinyl-diaminopimelate desuccinylase